MQTRKSNYWIISRIVATLCCCWYSINVINLYLYRCIVHLRGGYIHAISINERDAGKR